VTPCPLRLFFVQEICRFLNVKNPRDFFHPAFRFPPPSVPRLLALDALTTYPLERRSVAIVFEKRVGGSLLRPWARWLRGSLSGIPDSGFPPHRATPAAARRPDDLSPRAQVSVDRIRAAHPMLNTRGDVAGEPDGRASTRALRGRTSPSRSRQRSRRCAPTRGRRHARRFAPTRGRRHSRRCAPTRGR